jgi:predicted nuclease with TOPRIM domain
LQTSNADCRDELAEAQAEIMALRKQKDDEQSRTFAKLERVERAVHQIEARFEIETANLHKQAKSVEEKRSSVHDQLTAATVPKSVTTRLKATAPSRADVTLPRRETSSPTTHRTSSTAAIVKSTALRARPRSAAPWEPGDRGAPPNEKRILQRLHW